MFITNNLIQEQKEKLLVSFPSDGNLELNYLFLINCYYLSTLGD
jgi:hypothetical protein